MIKEKQIEEMAEDLRHSCEGECFRNKDGFIDCEVCKACLLYEAGYRKQSEGEWVFEHEFYGKMFCSNCKKEALVNEDNEYVDSDYCPYCGAKMKGV